MDVFHDRAILAKIFQKHFVYLDVIHIIHIQPCVVGH